MKLAHFEKYAAPHQHGSILGSFTSRPAEELHQVALLPLAVLTETLRTGTSKTGLVFSIPALLQISEARVPYVEQSEEHKGE